MAKKIDFKGFSIVEGNIRADLNMDRFTQNYRKAQYELDGAVMSSMVRFMPHLNGTFIQVTRAASAAIQGTGGVYAAYGIQGRYLYEGKVMVDSETGRGAFRIETAPGEYIFRFRKDSKLKATDRPLRYTKTHNPEAQAHWFDAAKKADLDKWVENAKKTAGGG